MKTMFKKTLVAAALVSLGFAAQAAEVETNVTNISKQGTVTGDLKAGEVVVTLGAAYAVNDTVTFTFSGGLKSAPLTITSTGGANAVTLGRTGLTATSATYRVTEISGAGADHGVLTFVDATPLTADAETAFVFKSADVVALGKVNLVYAASIGNTTGSLDSPVIYNEDEDLTSGALFNVRDQFAVSVTGPAAAVAGNKFNGVLDVGADREAFTGPTTQDVLNLTVTDRTGDSGAVARLNTTFVVKGDFSWAASKDVATIVCTGGASTTPVGTPTLTASSLTFVCDNDTSAVALTLDIDQADDTVAVSPTTFTVEATQAYGAGSALALPVVDAGAWTVNGSVVTIPYMAYGTIGTKTFSQIVNLTNNGSQSGSVYADVWATDANGKSSPVLTNVKVGTSNPKSTAKLAGELKKQVEAKGFKDGTVAIRLITDVKADTVSVYSAYVDNATSERAIVNNDSPVAATKVINN